MADGADLLDGIFEDDPFGLLDVRPPPPPGATEFDRLLKSFEEISAFYDEHGREPTDADDEFHLQARLESIRGNPEKRSALSDQDRHGLLSAPDDPPPASIDEILASDTSGILEDGAADIFVLKNVQAPATMPEYVARRKMAQDFEKFEPLFQQCQQDLNGGVRRTVAFTGDDGIAAGDFFILRGLLTYVAEKGPPIPKDGKTDHRLRCIFSNGTESDLLMLSLARQLYDEGRRVSRAGEVFLNLQGKETGYIYILRSLGTAPEIKSARNLFKIGFSRGPVTERIRNAEKDPTYLMAPVHLVEEFECYDLNVAKLEHLLHVFFSDAKFHLQVVGADGKIYTPKEWFMVPLEQIEEAVFHLEKGNILEYRYDPQTERIVRQ